MTDCHWLPDRRTEWLITFRQKWFNSEKELSLKLLSHSWTEAILQKSDYEVGQILVTTAYYTTIDIICHLLAKKYFGFFWVKYDISQLLYWVNYACLLWLLLSTPDSEGKLWNKPEASLDFSILLIRRRTNTNMHWPLPGVYILSQNFIITPKHNKCVMKIFIIAPNLHLVRNGIS